MWSRIMRDVIVLTAEAFFTRRNFSVGGSVGGSATQLEKINVIGNAYHFSQGSTWMITSLTCELSRNI